MADQEQAKNPPTPEESKSISKVEAHDQGEKKKRPFLPSLAALFGTKKEEEGKTPLITDPLPLQQLSFNKSDLSKPAATEKEPVSEAPLIRPPLSVDSKTKLTPPPLPQAPKLSSPQQKPALFSLGEKAPEKAKDVFSQITPQQSSQTDKILDQIVSQSDELSASSILGPRPEKIAFAGARTPLSYRAVQLLFRLVVLAAVLSVSYFYYELTLEPPYFQEYVSGLFEKNIAHKIDQTNEDIKKLKTEENANRYLAIALKLSQFSTVADTFLYKSAQHSTATSSKTESFLDDELTQEIKDILLAVKLGLSEPLATRNFVLPETTPGDMENEYKQSLKDYFREKRSNLEKQMSKQELKDELLKQLKDIAVASAIIDNKAFFTALHDLDVNKIKTKDIEKLYTLVNKLNKNEFTTITGIQNTRVRWSMVIKRLEDITKQLDPFFGHAVVSDIGTIAYNSYQFSFDGGTISLSGDLKTEDLRNFTLLSKLVDAFERSPYFKNVDVRTYSKSVQEKEELKEVIATSPLSILMELEGPVDIEEEQISLKLPEEGPSENEMPQESPSSSQDYSSADQQKTRRVESSQQEGADSSSTENTSSQSPSSSSIKAPESSSSESPSPPSATNPDDTTEPSPNP